MRTNRRTLAVLAGATLALVVAGAGIVQAAGRVSLPSAARDKLATTTTANLAPQSALDADTAGVDQLVATLMAQSANDLSAGLTEPAAAYREQIRERILARARRLVHAQVTVDLPQRGITTFSADHGTVGTIAASQLTVDEVNGDHVSVAFDSATRLRRDGQGQAGFDGLATGDEVVVIALKQDDGSWLARFVVVLPAATATAPGAG